MFKRFLSIKCNAFGMTDVGRARKHNEDNIRLNQEHSLFMVADGMGGHQAGEIASKIAADTIETALVKYKISGTGSGSGNDIEFPEVTAVTRAIAETNIKINQANSDRGLLEGKGMGTTIVGCWYMPEKKMSVIFNIGDSRAYSYCKQELSQITTDHSLLQLWKDKCFEGEKPSANVLTKALGPYPDVAPDVSLYPAQKGEKLLLCSDGLTTMVSDEKILDTMIQFKLSPHEIPEQLIIAANLSGGEDNISVVIIEFS
ncbi:MAG: protein phosphatase 2C domain-containing protein [Gammaproteobacteria bacterium]|nr:protein phosphatase 2C domain-containing protein [Gammaproteobacteria bacterium]